MTEWIKCSDRMPESDGRYLVLMKYPEELGFDPYIMIQEYFKKNRNFDTFYAWMPLPAVPNELDNMLQEDHQK